jgi:hypothetical protein
MVDMAAERAAAGVSRGRRWFGRKIWDKKMVVKGRGGDFGDHVWRHNGPGCGLIPFRLAAKMRTCLVKLLVKEALHHNP